MICTQKILYNENDDKGYFIIPDNKSESYILENNIHLLDNKDCTYYDCYFALNGEIIKIKKIECQEFIFLVFISILKNECNITWK